MHNDKCVPEVLSRSALAKGDDTICDRSSCCTLYVRSACTRNGVLSCFAEPLLSEADCQRLFKVLETMHFSLLPRLGGASKGAGCNALDIEFLVREHSPMLAF